MTHSKGKVQTLGLVIQKFRMRMNDTEVEDLKYLDLVQWSRPSRLRKFYAVLNSNLVLENSLRLLLNYSPLVGRFVNTSRKGTRALDHAMNFDRNG